MSMAPPDIEEAIPVIPLRHTKQNAIEKAWTSACATHAQGYVGIQIHQPDVARHLYRRGAAVRVAPLRYRPVFDDRDGYVDSADFEYSFDLVHWVRVEVKSRGLDFPPFKYKTIFVDRVGKIENTPATLYVSLNKQSTHIALVPLNSRDHWVGPTTVFDRKKRYPVVVFEAPIKVVRLMQIRDSV